MKIFQDNDGVIYTLDKIKELNEVEPALDADEMEQLESLEVGQRVNNPMDGFWIERVK